MTRKSQVIYKTILELIRDSPEISGQPTNLNSKQRHAPPSRDGIPVLAYLRQNMAVGDDRHHTNW